MTTPVSTVPTSPKPIETHYAGCRFRSRLEARWAVLFDNLGIGWQYEPEGYRVGTEDRPYLPDFYLPRQRTWIEVKGHVDALDFDHLVDACAASGGLPLSLNADDAEWPLFKLRMAVLGPIPEEPRWHLGLITIGGEVAIQPLTPLCRDRRGSDSVHEHEMAAIRAPAWLKPGTGGRRYCHPSEGMLAGVRAATICCFQIHAAYQAARSARFEHGESG